MLLLGHTMQQRVNDVLILSLTVMVSETCLWLINGGRLSLWTCKDKFQIETSGYFYRRWDSKGAELDILPL